MKKIFLKSIELRDFRSQNTKVEFKDTSSIIEGRNGCGKSSIMKAWFWLMSSYTTSSEVKNNNLYDNREVIDENPPPAAVTATVSIDGMEYVLKKTAKAKFVRKKGSDTYEKSSSDEYKLSIDNVEVSVSDFNSWIERNICPSDMIQYCLDGSFFVNLLNNDKVKARKVLENIIGDINDDDFKEDYSIISEDMLKYSIEEIEERTKTEIKPVKARINEIPYNIDTQLNALDACEKIDEEGILKSIDEKKGEISHIDDLILGNGESIKPILGKRDAIFHLINEKSCELSERRSLHMASNNEKTNAIKAELSELRNYNTEVDIRNARNDRELASIDAKIGEARRKIEKCRDLREVYLKQKEDVMALVFSPSKCAYCGQELPEETVSKMRSEFNKEKKTRLETIVANGKANTAEIKRTEEEITHLEEERNNYLEHYEKKDTSEVEARLSKAMSECIPFEETDEYKEISLAIESLKNSMPEIPQDDNKALSMRKKILMGEIDALNRKLGMKDNERLIRKTIDALNEERKTLSGELARLEQKLDACKRYTQERADIISYRVNGRMKDCRIDMWSTQKDGSIVPNVVLKDKDNVNFPSVNFSRQLKILCEIQSLFTNYYGISMPIFIDEASVFDTSSLPVYDAQTVYLCASDMPYLTIKEF